MTRAGLPFALIIGFLLGASCGASGQTSTGGDLQGIVRDASGGVLPGVMITATSETTGVQRETVSSSSGRYYIAALPPGRYTVSAELSGFAPMKRPAIVVQVGNVLTLDLDLQIGQLTESITVTQAAPLVETTRAQLGAVVNRQDIENLPINGRNFLDFAVTVPGVTDTRNTGQGSGFSVNGQRQRSNNVSVDGADSNGQLNGNTRMTVSQEAVQEFQVVTNQFAPEFGRSGGGIVNVVSKSGTNNLSGSAFLYFRDESMDARNAFVPAGEEKPPFRRKNVGGSLGGPIERNRTFYFGAYELIDRDESDVVTISDQNLAAINAALRTRPIPNAGVTAITNGTFPVTDTTTFASIKIDHAFSPRNQVNVRYNYGRREEINSGGVSIGGLTAVEGGGGRRTRDHAVVMGFLHAITPSLLSDARVQFAPRKQTQYANDPIGPRVTISGVGTFGRGTDFPVRLDETRWQVIETLSWQRERHFVKAGLDLNAVNALTSFPSAFAGSFTFGSLQTFLDGRPTTFTQGFGNPEIRLKDTLVGVFAQDSFRLNPHLTLVYGVRYDYDAQPQNVPRDRSNPVEAPLADGINRDGNNWQPRASLVLDPAGDGRMVVRTGYGRFYDKLFLLVARNVLLARQSISLSGAAAADRFARGAWPESAQLPAGQTLGTTNISRPSPDMELPYNDQISVEFERQFGDDWSVGAGYVYVRGRQLLVANNVNLAPPVVLTAQNAASLGVANPSPQQLGRNYYTRNRLDASFNQINQVSSTGIARYDALQLDVQKRMQRGLQIRASYVLSTAKDDGSDFTQAEMPDNPYDRAAEYALSMEHQRHRATMTAVWAVPKRSDGAGALLGDWTVSALLKYRSGTPRKVTVGSDVNADGRSETDRPFVNGVILTRNSLIGPDYMTLDLRLSRRFSVGGTTLQVLAEAFNVLNRVNYAGVNNTWGTDLVARSTLGQYTSANDPRQVQLGVRLQF